MTTMMTSLESLQPLDTFGCLTVKAAVLRPFSTVFSVSTGPRAIHPGISQLRAD